MDVQAATATLASAAYAPPIPIPGDGGPGASAPTPTPGVAPIAPSSVAPAPNTSGSQSSGPQTDPTPGLALLPPSSTTTNGNGSNGAKKDGNAPTLPGDVAKLYNASEQNVSVSFQVSRDADEVVTVFTDTQTGKVIVQFPSETLIALAQFFQKLNAQSDAAGAVVNKKV